MSIAQSVRLPWSISQNPSFANTSDFVVAKATSMIIINGIEASLVIKPIKTNMPHIISKTPTKLPKNSGDGKPILANLPDPSVSAKRNFWMPSERNTAPTMSRINIVVFELSVWINFLSIMRWIKYESLNLDS